MSLSQSSIGYSRKIIKLLSTTNSNIKSNREMWKASEKEIMKTYRQPRWYCECKEEKKKKCRNCFIRVHGNCRYVLACLFGKRFK